MADKRKCANCRWGEKVPNDNSKRMCRVEAPRVTIVNNVPVGYWPIVGRDEWCKAWNEDMGDWP
jgi:hypothetical protein